MAHEILIVDDEADIRAQIAGVLSDEGYETRSASDSDGTLAAIEARLPSMVLLDIWLQGSKRDGIELLKMIQESHPGLPVIMISGHGNIETAVQAIRLGAYDFIENRSRPTAYCWSSTVRWKPTASSARTRNYANAPAAMSS